VREAITALHYLTDQRTTRYIDQTNDRVRWRVLVNGTQIDGDKPSVADELMIERDNIETIDIYPVMEGAAGNIFGLIFGAILMVVGIVLFAVGGWSLIGLGALGATLALSGAAGVLGGLVSLFDKPSSAPKQKASQGNPSYLFSGTVNTQDQGGPVPVVYGNVIVGSQCIGAQVSNSDIFQTIPYSNSEFQVPEPYSASDRALAVAVKAMRGVENRNIQAAAVSTSWNILGSQALWGYCAKVTVVPSGFDTPTPQAQPPIYDNQVMWLMRDENGTLSASYQPGGNVGPWDCISAFPQEIDSITLTQNQDYFYWYNPSANIP
jgi:predicted phage tail protein